MTTPATSANMTPRSAPVLLADFLARCAAKKLNANGWQALQFARIIAEIDAETLNSYEVNRELIFDGGYIVSAVGVYLDLAATWYGERRAPATTAIVQGRFTDAAGIGPYPLPAGQIVQLDAPTPGGPYYYRSTQSFTVPKNGFIDVMFAAEAPGAGYNASPSSLTLRTPIPGITLTSPPLPGQGSILIIAGTDAELDDALRLRCLLLLSTLGRGWAKATIESLILDNFPAVTRLRIRDPGGIPGVADAYLADVLGPVTAATALAVYNFLRDETRKPVGDYPVRPYQATLLTKAITVQLYTHGANPSTLAAARLIAYQRSLDLGSLVLSSRVVDELVDVATGALGAIVIDVATGLPLANFQPHFSDAVVFAATFLAPIVV